MNTNDWEENMSFYNEGFTVDIYGKSHDEKIGVRISGFPAGMRIDSDKLSEFLSRRKPKNALATPRRESDEFIISSGITDGVTNGDIIEAYTINTNKKSTDYDDIKYIPRPGHADYAAYLKDGEAYDNTGGGRFSGRLTAPMCFAGALCRQYLEGMGVEIQAKIDMIGGVYDEKQGQITDTSFPTYSAEAAQVMRDVIMRAKSNGDSVGGIVSCTVSGLMPGIGDCLYNGLDGVISQAVFGIPAVKGIEFGAGFSAASMLGSENNDDYYTDGEKIYTKTNNCGGILGGITFGNDITFRVAFKPTPSIGKTQNSVDVKQMKNVSMCTHGRHDPCIVSRASVCVEAAAAIAICSAVIAEGRR